MLTKGSRAGGVGIKPGLRTVMLHGHTPEASSEGVPLFLQRELLFPTKQWNHTCELQPVRPGSWACNLVLGHSPEVSSQSWEGQLGRGEVQRSIFLVEVPAHPVVRGCGRVGFLGWGGRRKEAASRESR